jgi:hypothetical protein
LTTALVPSGAPDLAPAQPLLVASAFNLNPCPFCSSEDVESLGCGKEYSAANGGTEFYERYRCRACCKEWDGVPPNRLRDRRPPAKVAGRKVCPECGQTFNRPQSLTDHMRRKHPTEAEAGSFFLCQKCHEPFRTRAYCRDHQRLCTKTGDVIVCDVCGLLFSVTHHWTQHKAQTGHRGHTMRGPDGARVNGGEEVVAATVDDGVHLALVRRFRCGEPQPILFAEVVCAYSLSDEAWGAEVAGADLAARGSEIEPEGEPARWQAPSETGGPSGDEDEEWDDSDDELYDATPDGPFRSAGIMPLGSAGNPLQSAGVPPLGWAHPGGGEFNVDGMQPHVELGQPDLGEAVQVSAEELADEFF